MLVKVGGEHVDVDIPKGKLVVLAGVSGSGKSSLAFGTVAVESAREWQQSYPMFLRNKMPHYERPRVGSISGLTPAINGSFVWISRARSFPALSLFVLRLRYRNSTGVSSQSGK